MYYGLSSKVFKPVHKTRSNKLRLASCFKEMMEFNEICMRSCNSYDYETFIKLASELKEKLQIAEDRLNVMSYSLENLGNDSLLAGNILDLYYIDPKEFINVFAEFEGLGKYEIKADEIITVMNQEGHGKSFDWWEDYYKTLYTVLAKPKSIDTTKTFLKEEIHDMIENGSLVAVEKRRLGPAICSLSKKQKELIDLHLHINNPLLEEELNREFDSNYYKDKLNAFMLETIKNNQSVIEHNQKQYEEALKNEKNFYNQAVENYCYYNINILTDEIKKLNNLGASI